MQTHWETWKKLYSQGQTQWEILCLSILKILIAFQSHYKLGVMKRDRKSERDAFVCLEKQKLQVMSVIMVHSELYVSNCRSWMPFINAVGNSMCFFRGWDK